jgi:hypothetical protein
MPSQPGHIGGQRTYDSQTVGAVWVRMTWPVNCD